MTFLWKITFDRGISQIKDELGLRTIMGEKKTLLEDHLRGRVKFDGWQPLMNVNL